MTNSSQGFKDDSNGSLATDLENDYDYDLFGNMTKDQNKHITNIKYNHLNLPIEIDFDFNRKINYTYDAIGSKLKKEVFDGTYTTTTSYLDGYQHENKLVEIGGRGYNHLLFFPTAEGYVKPVFAVDKSNRTPKFAYVYNYTDHLANVRVSYSKVDGNLKVLEETNCYPFGLKHANYNASKAKLSRKETNDQKIIVPTNVNSYKYKYQGQERQDEFGLNWDSFKWRNYDYAIGRFMSIDPLAEKYAYQTTYQFSSNQPVHINEIEGLESTDDLNLRLSTNITTWKIFKNFASSIYDKAKKALSDTTFNINVPTGITTTINSNTQVTSFGNTAQVEVTVPKISVSIVNENANNAIDIQTTKLEQINSKVLDSLNSN